MQSAHEGGNVSATTGRLYSQDTWHSFLLEAESTPHQLEGILDRVFRAYNYKTDVVLMLADYNSENNSYFGLTCIRLLLIANGGGVKPSCSGDDTPYCNRLWGPNQVCKVERPAL